MLRGDHSPEHFGKLFLWLRERSYGCAAIREIGDFVAHSDERVKGAVTDQVRGFCGYLRYIIPTVPQRLSLSDLPARTPETARATFNIFTTALIKKETGLKVKDAKAALESALSKMIKKADGHYSMSETIIQDELNVLNCTLTILSAEPAFTDDDLWKQFCRVMEKNGLARPEQKRDMENLKVPLVLYAMTAMHLTDIVAADDLRVTLRAGIQEGMLCVYGGTECTRSDGIELGFHAAMLLTSLKASDWCDASLPVSEDLYWLQAIEMVSGPKLASFADGQLDEAELCKRLKSLKGVLTPLNY
jgi:hypothetical protein